MKEIDARKLACPQPVILTRQAMKAGEGTILIRVDNAIAVENLKRLADSQGYAVEVEGEEGDYALTLKAAGGFRTRPYEGPKAAGKEPGKEAKASVDTSGTDQALAPGLAPWAVFVGRDIVGAGDRELGGNLMRMYFYTLAQSDRVPAAILFMNDGVKLPTLDEQIRDHLQTLTDRGTRVLVCGTCLSFYGLTEKLKVGTVSNMYDIVTEMDRWGKVVTL